MPSPEDCDRWAGRIVWAIGCLRDWDETCDPGGRELRVPCMILDLTHRLTPVWSTLPDAVAANLGLRDAAGRVLTELSRGVMVVDFYSRSLRPFRPDLSVPHEGEGWAELNEQLARREIIPPSLLRPITRLLNRVWPSHLAVIVSGWTDGLAAAALVDALSPADAFRLGCDSRNRLVAFAAVLSHTEMLKPLGDGADDELTRLLEDAASNSVVWRAWMTVLNTYPVRYPMLQIALGRALARASDGSFEAWLDALKLHPESLSRAISPTTRPDAVTCLAAFAEAAAFDVRVAAWSQVWSRWNEWNFADREALLEVHGSILDLGVVGYALEVLDEVEVAEHIEAEARAINLAFGRWWPTSTALNSEMNRRQSRLQPLAHAQALRQASAPVGLAAVRYAISDPDLEWRLRRAGRS